MKLIVLIGALFIGACGSLLQAGSVFVFGSGSESDGLLSLNSNTIHVEGKSPSDINVTDVLEADFGETPFHLGYFSTTNGAVQLPADLKGVDIGHPTLAGSCSYADGTITLTGAGVELQRKEDEDQYYTFGQPWTGDGQLTVRLKQVDGPSTQAGPMVRESLDPMSIHFRMGASGQGGGLFRYRFGPTGHAAWADFGADIPPIWLRLTRSGPSIDAATSSDGQKWEIINQLDAKISPTSWLGFFLDSYSDKTAGKAILDQLTIAPCAAGPELVPPGVLLRSGSFLAGSFHRTDPQTGTLDRNGKVVALTTDQIAAVILHPVTQRQIADVAAQTGVIVKNGDYLAADIQNIDGGSITVNSTLTGVVSYDGTMVRAIVLHPVQPQPSDYEVRLKDGSIVRATGINAGGGQVAISEISGSSVDATSDEVAEIRAGLLHVQPLIDLPWKATAPPAAPVPAGTNTNAAPAVAVAPAIPADPNSSVLRWGGPNQEHILAVPAGTSLTFPLSGKFSALALRVALSSDAPPNALVVVRVLADGMEIARTSAFKAGDQPRFIQANLSSPRGITIMTDSNIAGTKTLLIDPVAIRQE